MASGPGSVWQTATAWRISSLVSHLRSETSSRSICPTRATGPPKPSAPRRRKYRTSSLRCFFGFTSVSDIAPLPFLLRCGDALRWRSVNPADRSAAAASFEGGSLKHTHGSSLDASSGEQSLDGKPSWVGRESACPDSQRLGHGLRRGKVGYKSNWPRGLVVPLRSRMVGPAYHDNRIPFATKSVAGSSRDAGELDRLTTARSQEREDRERTATSPINLLCLRKGKLIECTWSSRMAGEQPATQIVRSDQVSTIRRR